MPPYGCLSGILSVIWSSLLSPEKFSSVFFFLSIASALLILVSFSETSTILWSFFTFIIFPHHLISLIFLQCGRTAQDCLAHRSHHSKVSILISKVDFNYVTVSLFFLSNPFLCHLPSIPSLLILYLHLGTPISFIPHLLYIKLRRVKKKIVNISPVFCNKSPYRPALPWRLECVLYFIMKSFSMATYSFIFLYKPLK